MSQRTSHLPEGAPTEPVGVGQNGRLAAGAASIAVDRSEPRDLVGSGLHVAAIMDGNGRWAKRIGIPRSAGHRAGAMSVRRVVRTARELGVSVLSLYAFSSDNWKRPRSEVRGLLGLFRSYLRSEIPRLQDASIRLNVIGSREGLPDDLVLAIEQSEERTASGTAMRLRVAINYSGREAIRLASAGSWTRSPPSRDEFRAALGRAINDPDPPDDVDVLIRTGGECRLSDFLLWESAYAELFFTPTPWPDFSAEELTRILNSFRLRQRRFGGLPATGRKQIR